MYLRRLIKKKAKSNVNIECCQQQLKIKKKIQKKLLARKTTQQKAVKRAKEKWQLQMDDLEGDREMSS